LDEFVHGCETVLFVSAVDEVANPVCVGGHGIERVHPKTPGVALLFVFAANVDILDDELEVVDDAECKFIEVSLLCFI
jgi:hypothetical protein